MAGVGLFIGYYLNRLGNDFEIRDFWFPAERRAAGVLTRGWLVLDSFGWYWNGSRALFTRKGYFHRDLINFLDFERNYSVFK